MRRRDFALHSAAAAGLLAGAAPARATWVAEGKKPAGSSPVVGRWNSALLQALAATATDPTISSRAIGMVFEAVYNAWAMYHPRATCTLAGLRKQPLFWTSQGHRIVALSHAAHTVLCDLFPTERARFDAALAETAGQVPLGMLAAAARDNGLAAGRALLARRHADGANQLGKGTASGVPYADTSGYQPVNTPDLLVDPTRWQPLRIVNLQGQTVVQQFLTPHWGTVRPFALSSGSALRPVFGNPTPTAAEMDELIALSAALNPRTKAIVDQWAANPGSVTPAGQWTEIAQTLSQADGNSLDDDVRLFFTLGQALLDAGIACWDAKRAYDSVRPISAIRYHYRNQLIRSWGGPDQGTVWQPGPYWRPFQRAVRPSPPFPEFPSGHSTFSAAAAGVMAGLRGSDRFNFALTFPAGGVAFETNMPPQPVRLPFETLSAAAGQAGYSRRLGGIHFLRGDLAGRKLGRQVGQRVLAKALRLFAGDD